MAQLTGTAQVVRQGIADSISYRLLSLTTGEIIALTSATVVVVNPSGTAIAHGGSVSTSGAVATLAFTATAANFPVADGYRAIWTLNGTIKRTQFFDVVLRLFQSQVIDSDITDVYKGITLPDGITSWATWRLRAWRKIEALVRKALKGSPHTVFYPERFFDAHVALSVAEFYLPDTFDRNGEEYLKYQSALREGLDLFRQAMATLDYDADGDGLLGSGDTGHDLRPWTQREWDAL